MLVNSNIIKITLNAKFFVAYSIIIYINLLSTNYMAPKSRFYGPPPPICYALVTLSS